MHTDEEIIALFFARSEQGIRELDLKYGRVCHRLSYNILGDAQDAEECVSDAYLGAWNAIPPAKPDPLLTYICKIVRNVSLKLQEKSGQPSGAAVIRSPWRRSNPASRICTRRKTRPKRGSWHGRSDAFWTRSLQRTA